MDIYLYLKCFAVALIGWAIQTALKMKAIQGKAKLTGAKFKPSDYFIEDWLSIAISWLTIIMFLFFMDNALKWKPLIVDYIDVLFAFVGYTSSDAASRIFSVVNKRINSTLGEDTKDKQQ